MDTLGDYLVGLMLLAIIGAIIAILLLAVLNSKLARSMEEQYRRDVIDLGKARKERSMTLPVENEVHDTAPKERKRANEQVEFDSH